MSGVTFRKPVQVTLKRDRTHWNVSVSSIKLEAGDIWVVAYCPTDPIFNDKWTNLSDFTSVNGGGPEFAKAKMRVLETARPPAPKEEPKPTFDEQVIALQRMWKLPTSS